jgi:hypothetical protein
MKRRPKPEPDLTEGERPPCGFLWKVDNEDGHLYSDSCACGLAYGDHPRYREAMRQTIAADRGAGGLRKQIEKALAERIAINERAWPLKTGVLRENGHSRRYLLDGEAIDFDDSSAGETDN